MSKECVKKNVLLIQSWLQNANVRKRAVLFIIVQSVADNKFIWALQTKPEPLRAQGLIATASREVLTKKQQ